MKSLKILCILLIGLLYVSVSKAQLIDEDFESGLFPPTGWSNPGGWGSVVWSNYWGVSGYGIGDYSAFYDGYYWDGDVDSMITDVFSQTTGEALIFDHAYAPYDNTLRQRGNSAGTYIYSDLYIYYRLDGDDEWYLLDIVTGTSLQTSSPTWGFFEPTSSEWGTRSIELPYGTVQISFVADNFNSNNLYLDNIRVDYAPTGTDMAVNQVYAKGLYPRLHNYSDTISAHIQNLGATSFQNSYVYMEMTGANYHLDSVFVPELNSGQSMVVSFPPYQPISNGMTNIRVFVPVDDNSSNDEAYYNMGVNQNVISFNDTTVGYCCGIGWFGEGYWLTRYRVDDPNTRIKRVKLSVTGAPTNVGQIVRAVVLDSAGTIVAKSDPYKLKASDDNTFVSFNVSDPVPYKVRSSSSTFFVGIEQTAIASSDDAYGIQRSQDESPTRENTFFGAYGMKPVGTQLGVFPWTDRWGMEAVITSISNTDVGISSVGQINEQYYSSATTQPKGKVYNSAASGSANATVFRKISPGGYINSQSVNIPANSSVEVTFANWTFTSGTAYTVTDSIVLAGDNDLSDNVLKGTVTPRVAKQLAVVYSKIEDRDSLVRAINLDGRFAGNFDTIPMHYNGSLRPFKYVFMNFRRAGNWTDAMRDSIKAFIDASTAANKKSFVLFHNTLTYVDPQISFNPNPADTIFLRQYLKARFVSENWQVLVPADRKFKGKNYFSTVTQDSLYDEWDGNYNPDLIRPVNGSFAAFVPQNVTGSGNDSAIAVAYAGPNYNTFVMSNQFHALRAKNGGLTDGPGRIYARIIDWINSTNTNAKVLDLTMLIEGFYDQGANTMVRDTVRVYLRNTSSPYAVVDSAKGYLGTNGVQSFVFNNASNGVNYFIQVKHRNAVETWSRTGSSFTSNYLAYNFTSDSGKAYGFNMVKKGAKWVFYGGDVNQDGFIDGTDNTLIDNDAFNFISGYVKTDLNGDDFVDASDFAISDNNAYLFIGEVTPGSEPEFMVLNNADMNYTTSPAVTETATGELKIDHEIYERFRNAPAKAGKVRSFKIGDRTFLKVD